MSWPTIKINSSWFWHFLLLSLKLLKGNMTLTEYDLTLSWRSSMFPQLMNAKCFLRFSCIHCNFLEKKSVSNVWFQYKSVNPLPFVLKIFLKANFFVVTCNNILEKKSFLYHERKLVAMDIQSFLFFSLRVWGTQILRLLTFPFFFKWWQTVDWDVLRSSANSQLLLSRGLMRVQVWVHLLMTYHQNETLKTHFAHGTL